MATATVSYTWYLTTTSGGTSGGSAIGTATSVTSSALTTSSTITVKHTIPAAAVGKYIYLSANVASVSDTTFSAKTDAKVQSLGTTAVSAASLTDGSITTTSLGAGTKSTKYTITAKLPLYECKSSNKIMGSTSLGSTITCTTTATIQWGTATAVPTTQGGTTAPANWSVLSNPTATTSSGSVTSTYTTPAYGQGAKYIGVAVTFATVTTTGFSYTSKTYYMTTTSAITANSTYVSNIALSGTPTVGEDITATITITCS